MTASHRPDDDGLKDGGMKVLTMTEDLPEEEPIEVTVEEPEVEPEPVDPLTEALQRAEAAEKKSPTAKPTCRTHGSASRRTVRTSRATAPSTSRDAWSASSLMSGGALRPPKAMTAPPPKPFVFCTIA